MNLSQLLDMATRGALEGVRVALPGKIVAYDKLKQRADVRPMVGDRYEVEGTTRAVLLPTVPDVPVAFQGAGGYSETFPIAVGDTVLLVFCSSSIARWKTGGGGSDGDPGDDRRHTLNDAIAYAGVRDAAHALTGVPSDAWVITVPSGKQIRLGSAGASQSSILGDAFLSRLSDLVNAISAAVGLITTSTPGATAATAIDEALEVFEGAASTYKSSRIKVE